MELNGRKVIHAVVRDITERKQAEKLLKDSETKFKTIFENSGGAIFIADPQVGIIVECNQLAEELLGRSREEIIGMSQTKLHPEGEAEKYREKFTDHIKLGHVSDYEGEVEHKDGRRIPVLIAAQIINLGDKELLAGLFIDITERKKVEKRVNKINQLQTELLASGTISEKARKVTETVVNIFGADFCRIWITSPGDRCSSGCVHATAKEEQISCRDKKQCLHLISRSEERRVGKECRSRWSPYH